MVGLSFFLSCLCGSERADRRLIVAHSFLSCLCGSELCTQQEVASKVFLSCLCGSEPYRVRP